MANDKATLVGRVSSQHGRGTGANTGAGSADINVPKLPTLPEKLTPESIAEYNREAERWHANFQAQFPIPLTTTT